MKIFKWHQVYEPLYLMSPDVYIYHPLKSICFKVLYSATYNYYYTTIQ